MGEVTYTVDQNGIEAVRVSIIDGGLLLKVTLTGGRTFYPTQDVIPIQPDNSDEILKALDALKELLNEHGIARRRG